MEKDLKDRLIKYFSNTANSQNDFIIPRQIGVFARREADFYTFGIPGSDYLNFYEEFNSCIMKTGLEGNKPYLYFSCKELSEEFVDFCLTSFIPPEKREEITSDPAAWFEKISAIFGNTNSSTATSDKIAELYVFWQMKRSGLRNISFGGYNKKSLRDIQCEGFEVEVKSTLNHHAWPIYTNPEQIGTKKESGNCYFVLCRLENAESVIGKKCYSLNTLKQELSGYSGCEDMLNKLPRNTSLLNKMYVIRDIKVFTVDENFPAVNLTGCPGCAVLKNFVLDLNPDALHAKSLEEFLKEKGGVPPADNNQPEASVAPERYEEETAVANVSRPKSIKEFLIQTYGENVSDFHPYTQVGLPVYNEAKDDFFIYLPFAQAGEKNSIKITREGYCKNESFKVNAKDVLKMQIAVRDADNNYGQTILPTRRTLADFLSNELIIDQSGYLLFKELEDQDQFRLEWALVGADIVDDDTKENYSVHEKHFAELKYFCDYKREEEQKTEEIMPVAPVAMGNNTGFSSFKNYEFGRSFTERKITSLIVPGRTWIYEKPATAKTALHDFFDWFWTNHQAILDEKARNTEKKNDRYATCEEDLRERRGGLDLYKISDTCYFDQRFSLADVCKEMQKLLKEAYGDELDETSGISWIKN